MKLSPPFKGLLTGKRGKGKTLAFFLLVIGIPGQFPAADTGSPDTLRGYPFIARLDPQDTGFRQYLQDVETSRRRVFGRERSGGTPGEIAEALTIYQYRPLAGDDIFTVAARCNIPYAAISTLNGLTHPVEMEDAGLLLLPSAPGIFIPREPVSDLERLCAAARNSGQEGADILLTINMGGQKKEVFFYPGGDFSPTERNFFLNRGFRFPLRNFRLTSPYGMRRNPVTGRMRLHEGMDLAAPAGTGVFAAGDGVVTETGEDPVYGRYIIIKHGDNWASLYGHLQKIETALRSEVRSGSLIGRVGSTGQSTGPHLHFELRRYGQARDPGKYLFQSEF